MSAEADEAKESRRQWQLSFDMTRHGIALIDPASDLITRVNPAFAEMHGGRPEDFVGAPIAAMIGPQRRPRTPALVQTNHQPDYLHVESERVRLDGSTFPADVEVVAGRDADGCLLYRAAFVTDLSEVRTRETAERRAIERFERAFEDAPVGMVLARGGRIERVNGAAVAIFGRNLGELTDNDWRSLAHPEDAPWSELVHADLVEGRTPPTQDRRTVRPDGRVVHTRITYSVLHENGWDDGPLSLVVLTDRTAEVEAEQARATALDLFSTAIDQAPIGMRLVGLDGRFLRVNAAPCRLLGRDEQECSRATSSS